MNRIILIQKVAKSIAETTGMTYKAAINSVRNESLDNLKFYSENF